MLQAEPPPLPPLKKKTHLFRGEALTNAHTDLTLRFVRRSGAKRYINSCDADSARTTDRRCAKVRTSIHASRTSSQKKKKTKRQRHFPAHTAGIVGHQKNNTPYVYSELQTAWP